MELDELKIAWSRLGSQLEQQNRMNLLLLRDKKLDKTRKSLRPLFWSKILQILLGIVSIVFAVKVWNSNLDTTAVFISGLVVHAYGILLIASAGEVLGRISKLDYSDPVLDIQKQLLRIERAHVTGGWLVGLPWWLLWIPFSLGLAGLAGFDLFTLSRDSSWITWSLVTGIIGMALTWLWYRWATHSRRNERAQRVKDTAAGNSLTRAKRFMREVEEFEQDKTVL